MLAVSERPGSLPPSGFGLVGQQTPFSSPSPGGIAGAAAGMVGLMASNSALTSTFGARFTLLVDAVRQRFSEDVALLQVWTLVNGQTWSGLARRQLSGVVAQTHSNPCALHDAGLLSFRNKCCKHGIRGPAMGMVGKAWSSGSLCVVQNAETLPQMLHPRTKLECTDSIAGLVYIPVFDHAVPSSEVQAVIEVMLSNTARDPMAVANVITFIGGFLGQLQMSLSNAVRQQAQQCASAFQQHSQQQQQQAQQPAAPVTRIGQAAPKAGQPAAADVSVEQMPSPTRSMSRSMSRTCSIRDLGSMEVMHHAASM